MENYYVTRIPNVAVESLIPECPMCGNSSHDDELIGSTKSRINPGGPNTDQFNEWEELYECRSCGFLYYIHNSN